VITLALVPSATANGCCASATLASEKKRNSRAATFLSALLATARLLIGLPSVKNGVFEPSGRSSEIAPAKEFTTPNTRR